MCKVIINVSPCFRIMSSTPTRNPLKELQIPASLSNRSPVTTVAKPSFDILELPAVDDEGVENMTAVSVSGGAEIGLNHFYTI